jgi:hypothetical protein
MIRGAWNQSSALHDVDMTLSETDAMKGGLNSNSERAVRA